MEPTIGFWGLLLGSVYPNIALIKTKERLANVEPVYPVSINTDEEKNNILSHITMRKRK